MYIALGAIGIEFGINKRWTDVDITKYTVEQLFVMFKQVQVTMLQPPSPQTLYLDLSALHLEYSTYRHPLQDILNAQTFPLPTTLTPISIDTRVARYRDATAAGYSFTPVTHSNTVSQNNQLAEVTDVRLTHKTGSVNYVEFFENCLVSVNGLYHLCDTDGINGVVVTDGFTSVKLSSENNIGIYSFKQIGKIKTIPIKNTMISMAEDGKITLQLEQDYGDKQVLISLGGYLHYVDNSALTKTSDTAFKIDFTKIPLLERYYESSRYMDLSRLPVNNTPLNLHQIGSKDVWSYAFLSAYMQLSQTFVVVIDTPSMYVQHHPVRNTRLTDMYVAYQRPEFPLLSKWGRTAEYWVTEEDEHYTVTTTGCIKANHLFSTVDSQKYLSVSDHREPEHAYDLSEVSFLEIGTQLY